TSFFSGINNILDKFNPGARQLINAGKAYLKALHDITYSKRLQARFPFLDMRREQVTASVIEPIYITGY
ncbi:hypothetical protein L9F63_016511, partial [Diploptera punctata]